MKEIWLLENVRDYYCKFASQNETECLSNNVSSCYADNCFDAITRNFLCINENCQSKITQCLTEQECGSLYLNYLENKQNCYDTRFTTSNGTCRCRQNGDPIAYYSYFPQYKGECQDSCDECDQDSYEYVPITLQNASSSQLFVDIFSCLFQDCSFEYDWYITPDISASNIVNDIQTCDYSLDALCLDSTALCWADYDCFNAFFVNYDYLMNILSNNNNLMKNNFSVQIQTNFEITKKSISKYHCDPQFKDDSLDNFVCNDIFFNLIDCILNKCIFENDNNNCYYSSCEQAINNCLNIEDNSVFNPTRIEYNPAICYQGLYWLSWTYFNRNNDINLEYLQYVDGDIDCTAKSDTAQCYYYNIVGYCIKNMCTDSFWNVIDCIFENKCIDTSDNNENIDYSLSGTTLDIFNDDKLCTIGTYRYWLWLDVTDYNACQLDFYKYFSCNVFQYPPNNSTLYLQDLTSYSDYNNLYGQDCDASSANTGYLNGSLYFYHDCSSNYSDFYGRPPNDWTAIYIVATQRDINLWNRRLNASGLGYFMWTSSFISSSSRIDGKRYSGLLEQIGFTYYDVEYLFGECASGVLSKNWTRYNWTAYTSFSPTNSPTTEPTTNQPTISLSPTITPSESDSATTNYCNIVLFFAHVTFFFVLLVLIENVDLNLHVHECWEHTATNT